MNPAWSIALAAVGLTGLWLAGRKNKAGWAVGCFAQTLWIAYAIVAGQWGFIATACAYFYVYAANWLKWAREDDRGPEMSST